MVNAFLRFYTESSGPVKRGKGYAWYEISNLGKTKYSTEENKGIKIIAPILVYATCVIRYMQNTY